MVSSIGSSNYYSQLYQSQAQQSASNTAPSISSLLSTLLGNASQTGTTTSTAAASGATTSSVSATNLSSLTLSALINPSTSTTGGDTAQDAVAALFNEFQQSQSTSSSGASATSSSSSANNPASQLFSQLDTNDDGTISETELESAVTAGGGTKASADALYAQLDPNAGTSSDTGITQQDLTQGVHHAGGHHHHHGGGGSSTDSTASTDDSTDAALAGLIGGTTTSTDASGTQTASNDVFSLFDTTEQNGTPSGPTTTSNTAQLRTDFLNSLLGTQAAQSSVQGTAALAA